MTALVHWLRLGDYEEALIAATRHIVKRQSRGSIFAQNGWYISRKQLDKNSREADKHIANLNKLLKAN